MTSIRSFSEILRDSADMPAEMKERYSGIIHTEAMRLTRLLDDLLDLSVLEDGRVSLNLTKGALSDVLDTALASAGVTDDSVLTVVRRLPREAHPLYTDVDRLSQVFINVISNVRKYCDAVDPMLSIRVAETEGMITVDFVDNGSGVPSELRDVIFEKFSRVGENKAGGAGLGLAICREIMARLGGDISYLSGQDGAAFRVQFPVNMDAIIQSE